MDSSCRGSRAACETMADRTQRFSGLLRDTQGLTALNRGKHPQTIRHKCLFLFCYNRAMSSNPGMDSMKWKALGKLPGANSTNTWSSMKVLNKGLQPATAKTQKEKESMPSILSDEKISPYIRRAIEKRLPSAKSAAAASENPYSGIRDTMQRLKPLTQKFQGWMAQRANPLNGINQFLGTDMGRMASGVLPMLLSGGGGGRPPQSKYMRGVGGQMRRLGFIQPGSATNATGVKRNRVQ